MYILVIILCIMNENAELISGGDKYFKIQFPMREKLHDAETVILLCLNTKKIYTILNMIIG